MGPENWHNLLLIPSWTQLGHVATASTKGSWESGPASGKSHAS